MCTNGSLNTKIAQSWTRLFSVNARTIAALAWQILITFATKACAFHNNSLQHSTFETLIVRLDIPFCSARIKSRPTPQSGFSPPPHKAVTQQCFTDCLEPGVLFELCLHL